MTTSNRSAAILVVCILVVCLSFNAALAQRDTIPDGYPASLLKELEILHNRYQQAPHDTMLLLRLSATYLDLGDDLYTEHENRVTAYERGAQHAREAWEHDPAVAEAHFLYAANRGNVARLSNLAAGAAMLDDVLRHIRRTLELDDNHAPAHQMLGGLLAELPWFLGGDRDQARHHLERAITIDANYTNARILLAKLFITMDDPNTARLHLHAALETPCPHYLYHYHRRVRPEAEQLLRTLEGQE